jgi:hypothetical protein
VELVEQRLPVPQEVELVEQRLLAGLLVWLWVGLLQQEPLEPLEPLEQ